MTRKSIPIRDVCHIAIITAIIVICAQISIQQPSGVPFALQSWGVTLSGLILGPKKGVLAVLVYIALGAAGVPVFVQGTGGVSVTMRHTGGFIVSFPLLALFAGLGAKQGGVVWVLLGVVAGTVINLTVGMFWFSWVMEWNLSASFAAAVAPFILPEAIKTVILPLISKSIKTALAKERITL